MAQTYPLAVSSCNIDLETLIADPNRSIATLAITTLLKTGNESSIERLLKQIGGFMGDIADEFKMQVVGAIRNLCVKYPQKHRQMLHFLASNLREEGGFDYKKVRRGPCPCMFPSHLHLRNICSINQNITPEIDPI